MTEVLLALIGTLVPLATLIVGALVRLRQTNTHRDEGWAPPDLTMHRGTLSRDYGP